MAGGRFFFLTVTGLFWAGYRTFFTAITGYKKSDGRTFFKPVAGLFYGRFSYRTFFLPITGHKKVRRSDFFKPTFLWPVIGSFLWPIPGLFYPVLYLSQAHVRVTSYNYKVFTGHKKDPVQRSRSVKKRLIVIGLIA